MILLLYDVSVNSSRENYVVSVRSLVFLHVVIGGCVDHFVMVVLT